MTKIQNAVAKTENKAVNAQGKQTVNQLMNTLLAGEKLKSFFPYQADDINELPDEISY